MPSGGRPATAAAADRIACHGVAASHAKALVFYGVRLSLYLLYREVVVDMRQIKPKAATLTAKQAARLGAQRIALDAPRQLPLDEAARSLRALTMERDTMRLCEKLMPDYTDLVYTGRWFHPARTAMDALFADATKHVTGDVTVRLFKGTATSVTADSPYSLYSEDLATFGDSASFDQADSRGFVKLYGLPGSVAAQVQGSDQDRGMNS